MSKAKGGLVKGQGVRTVTEIESTQSTSLFRRQLGRALRLKPQGVSRPRNQSWSRVHKPEILCGGVDEQCCECNECAVWCDVCASWYLNDEPCIHH